MKRTIMYGVLGFIAAIIPLMFLDFLLHNAFLTNGYINNSIVGNIVSFQLTSFQGFWLGLAGAALVARDFYAGRKLHYKLRGNERAAGLCAGVLAAGVLLLIPWPEPNGY